MCSCEIRKSLSTASLYLSHSLLTPSLSPSFQYYSSSHSVTVHMVLQHCWSPVATLPTMHLWLWAFDAADRLRGLWYRPAIAWCEVSSVQHWCVSEQHTSLTFSLSGILPINPQLSALGFASREFLVFLCCIHFFKTQFFHCECAIEFFFSWTTVRLINFSNFLKPCMVSHQTLAASFPFETIMTKAHLENIKDNLLRLFFLGIFTSISLCPFHFLWCSEQAPSSVCVHVEKTELNRDQSHWV